MDEEDDGSCNSNMRDPLRAPDFGLRRSATGAGLCRVNRGHGRRIPGERLRRGGFARGAGQLGTSGCGVKQQLEASVRSLSRNDEQASFMKYDRLLAVLVVSDEDDCSIEDRGLFETPEWKSGLSAKPDDPTTGLLNTACNMPRSNEEDFLFSTDRYWTELVKLKGDRARDVVFAAIVGVPAGDDSPCQGRGNEIGDCLSHEDMQLKVSFQNNGDGDFRHFEPVCERMEGEDLVTSARPGRRYVKVAESFGVNGYVHSICNRDWSPVLREIAKIFAGHGSTCYPKHLDWSLLSEKRQEELDCPDCGVSECSVVVTFKYGEDEGQTCPAEFGVDPRDVFKEHEEDNNGEIIGILLNCPLPKLPAEFDCERARARYPMDGEVLGWFYCEDRNEDFDETCADRVDNDGLDGVDCDDAKCAKCCTEGKVGCRTSCKYSVALTRPAREAAWGNMVSVRCPKHIPTEDENCQENTHAACNDRIDNNGDGTMDCGNDYSPGGYNLADPHCCPMTVDENQMCVIEEEAFDNCGGNEKDLPDACEVAAIFHRCGMSNQTNRPTDLLPSKSTDVPAQISARHRREVKLYPGGRPMIDPLSPSRYRYNEALREYRKLLYRACHPR